MLAERRLTRKGLAAVNPKFRTKTVLLDQTGESAYRVEILICGRRITAHDTEAE